MDEIRSAYVEELDVAAEAPNPNGGGDSGSSRASVASSVNQKPRLAGVLRNRNPLRTFLGGGHKWHRFQHP